MRETVEKIIIKGNEIVGYKYSDGRVISADEALEELKTYIKEAEKLINTKNENSVKLLPVPTKAKSSWIIESPYIIKESD